MLNFSKMYLFMQYTTEKPYAFSAPYLYSSLTFGGDQQYIDCIVKYWNSGMTLEEGDFCRDFYICVQDESYRAEISKKYPYGHVKTAFSEENFYVLYDSANCNVIAGDQFQVSESATLLQGVQRTSGLNYTTTVDMIPVKSEPVAMITRKDDIAWSDFVNWVVNGLLYSEQKGYNQGERLPGDYLEWDVFGDAYKKSFSFTNEAVGSLRDLYERNLEVFVPRQKINTINNGTLGGVQYSVSYGNLTRSYGPEPLQSSTLHMIQNRNLTCGVRYETVFAHRTMMADGGYNYSGFDVDYCRALSAAIFDGDPNRVNYTDLTNSERFEALQNKSVDVLSRITTFTLFRDVRLSLTFSQPTFFDKLFFAGEQRYVWQCGGVLIFFCN
jgi:hypothetical protein